MPASHQEIFDQLQSKIKNLNESSWTRRADWKSVKEWLDQFEGSLNPSTDEQLQLLFLLSHFLYFGSFEIRAMMRSLYKDKFRYSLICRTRTLNGHTTDLALINASVDTLLHRTRFISLGNPSESSAHLLYYFRQENSLAKGLFSSPMELVRYVQNGSTVIATLNNPAIENYVFIDDLCGSGHQVDEYTKEIVPALRALHSAAGTKLHMYYYAAFANSTGLNNVRLLNRFDIVDAVVEFDDTFKAFDPNSRFYTDETLPIDRVFAESICRKYGSKMFPNDPLGYNDNQLLVGFGHNTPDNTLPVIWYDEPNGVPWTPMFRRYPKWY